MIEQFIEGLYKNIVEGNMKLYRQFFLYDPNEEGTIEYWKNAIAFYDKLDDKDKEILFSIIFFFSNREMICCLLFNKFVVVSM